MNYYDELIEKIRKLIDDEEYPNADRLITNELEMPYVPKEVEEKLEELRGELNYLNPLEKNLTDEKIESFLLSDNDHQLLAVNELDHRNLREYISLCERYLSSDGFKNAKVLLIDSLIGQQIDNVFHYRTENESMTFNPSLMKRVNETEEYRRCINRIYESYLKEPSKAKLAEQLLYKEFLMALPLQIDGADCEFICEKIIQFSDQALNS